MKAREFWIASEELGGNVDDRGYDLIAVRDLEEITVTGQEIHVREVKPIDWGKVFNETKQSFLLDEKPQGLISLIALEVMYEQKIQELVEKQLAGEDE